MLLPPTGQQANSWQAALKCASPRTELDDSPAVRNRTTIIVARVGSVTGFKSRNGQLRDNYVPDIITHIIVSIPCASSASEAPLLDCCCGAGCGFD